MTYSPQRIGGTLLLVGLTQFILLLQISEVPKLGSGQTGLGKVRLDLK